MTSHASLIPAHSVTLDRTGATATADARGMRPMQARAYAKRGEKYLLIKSPPASGKSRALMFLALDKLRHQGVRQAIVTVPERSIGGSFASEPLSRYGFEADWEVRPQWNLCDAPGNDEDRVARSKVAALGRFLESEDQVLVCTHATFRFAMEEFGVEAFDDRLIAIDEFHHVSANPDNKLGEHIRRLMDRDRTHLIAMTGSYFRGDTDAVLMPDDEARFETVTYTYHEQLNGYRWLKRLDLGYCFYTGGYVDELAQVLDPNLKTIVHIPSVNSRESLKDKIRETENVMSALGEWRGQDTATGFDLVELRDGSGRTLRVANLVDDADPARRTKVLTALKDPAKRGDRDHVDVIIALGMAKEGFDWIWCEHALTIGYRNSLTEVVQIIGRATRDAPEKTSARFTNFVAQPDASQDSVVGAVNDMLKAIAASLLMEQVMAPRFEFAPKNAESGPREGFDYGDSGYQPGGNNVGHHPETGAIHVEIRGLAKPLSKEGKRIVAEDLQDIKATLLQSTPALEQAILNENAIPQETTQVVLSRIVREKYPSLSEHDQEAVRQHVAAEMALTRLGGQASFDLGAIRGEGGFELTPPPDGGGGPNTKFVDNVRRWLSSRDLSIDLIDAVEPFGEAYAVLAKALDPRTLAEIQSAIAAKRVSIPYDDARDLTLRAKAFRDERGRNPALTASDPWERKMAEGVAAFTAYVRAEKARQERALEATDATS